MKMGNWSEQQENRRESKEKEKINREILGKYFYDLSKLSFMALFLGAFSSFIFAYIGYKILKR